MEKVSVLIGRILLAQIFLLAGTSKIFEYAGTQSYMEAMGVPGALLPLVILLEIGGSLALIIGWQTRWAAAALAGVLLLGARKGKYNTDGSVNAIPGANLPMATLGTFILWLG